MSDKMEKRSKKNIETSNEIQEHRKEINKISKSRPLNMDRKPKPSKGPEMDR